MQRSRPILAALLALALSSSLIPARAQTVLPPPVLAPAIQELSAPAQQQTPAMRQFYQQISDLWLELRLDPSVNADDIRKQLDQASEILNRLEKGLVGSDPNNKPDPKQELSKAYQLLLDAQIRMMPTRPVELRGALVDGSMLPTNAPAMRALMQKLRQAGFNAIYPEVFKRGQALFPNPVVEMDPTLGGVDVLKLVVEAAAAEKMDVYPWFWMFRVLSPTVSRQNGVVRRLPALKARPLDGQAYRSVNEEIEDESESFFSPAAQEWRQLLAGLMTQTARKYPVQGFLMDYIRYGNNQTEDEISQTRFQLDYYRRVGSFPPVRIDPASDLQSEWHLWREEQVHNMVRELRLQFASQKPDLALGAAVFRNEIQARMTKMQHWRHWSNNHWVDYLAPMFYTTDHRQLDLWMEWESDQGQRHDVLYPIIGAHKIQGDRFQLMSQIETLQNRQANGVSLFAIRQVTDQMLKDLGRGPFRSPARIPHSHIPGALHTQLTSSANWMRGMIQRGSETQSLSQNSRSALQTLATRLDQAAMPFAQAPKRNARIDGERTVSLLRMMVTEAESTTRSLPVHLRERVVNRVKDALNLAQIYATHVDVKDTRYQATSKPPSGVVPEARPLPGLTVKRAAGSIEVDGRIGEAAWSQATVLPKLFWSTGSGRPQVQTEVRLLYDNNNLYVAYVNDEPRTDRMQVSQRQDARVANEDDAVHVFINPVDEARHYYYFVVNPANARLQRASFDSNWNQSWQSATRAFSHGWVAEMALPFRSMGARVPDAKRVWRANFCRRRPQEIQDFHCWSVTFGGIHRVDRFGSLRFDVPAGTPAP